MSVIGGRVISMRRPPRGGLSGSANAGFLEKVLQNIPGILNVTVLGGSENPVGNRYIVRTTGGLLNLPLFCKLGLRSTIQSIDGPGNHLFLLTGSSSQSPNLILNILESLPGVIDAELDQVVNVATGGAPATTPPPSLVDTTPVPYYGSTAWNGYVSQPATQIIHLPQAQQNFHAFPLLNLKCPLSSRLLASRNPARSSLGSDKGNVFRRKKWCTANADASLEKQSDLPYSNACDERTIGSCIADQSAE